MLNPLFDIAPLRHRINAGTLILTPNLRLARKIREAWDLECQQGGLAIWTAPRIMALESWLQDLWMELVDAAWPPALVGTPIKAAQEQWLWEQCIARESDDYAPLHPRSFAELAQKGWQLVQQWQVPAGELQNSHHEGAKTLLHWGRAWEQQLKDRQLVSTAQRAAIVMEGFKAGAVPAVNAICLVGFQSLSPLYQAVLDAATGNLEQFEADTRDAIINHLVAGDTDSEIASAASWALTKAAADPNARIGVVVPDLAQLRAKVERIFLHHFDPSWCWPDSAYRPLPFNISATTPLADAPVVKAALELLQLNRPQLAAQDICQLLNNPFWGRAQQEGPLRSRAIVGVLDTGQPELSSGLLRQLVNKLESSLNTSDLSDSSNKPAGLAVRLTQFADVLRRQPGKLSLSRWREVFEAQLSTLGWPGERPLNSLEYQQWEHWQDLLDEFEQLDRVADAMAVDSALQQLQRLATNSGFQAQTPDAQVQILGTLEAAGLRFSHLWVMQMDDRHWPAATEPHPLLPVAMQRALSMPRASPQRELALSNSLFTLFCASADEVMFSHASQEGDVHFQPASLLAEVPKLLAKVPKLLAGLPPMAIQVAPQPASALHPWTASIAGAQQLEIIEDSHGPALALLTAPLTAGLTAGLTAQLSVPLPRAASFIAAQANCPFNAFATYRLGAEPLQSPSAGLSHMDRGNLVHFSLEAFWRDLGGHDALSALSAAEREQQLAAAIDSAFVRFLRYSTLSARELGERYLHIEQQRIRRLLLEWLDCELERASFTVEALELACELDLEGFPVRVRIDRLDQLPDGSQVIIDYKTGAPGIGALAGERLTEPQLALYALATGEPLAAIGYGLINARIVGFEGVASGGQIIPGAKTLTKIGLDEEWLPTLNKWRNQLIEIKNEILEGQAAVVFYSKSAQLYSAALEPLNRWPEQEHIAQFKARGQAAAGGKP